MKKMSKYKYLKEEVFEANMEIPKQRLAIATFGNVSGIDRKEGVVAIKPSGVPYYVLKVSDMVLVDLDNKVVEGEMRPSSDTKTHVLLYNSYESIGGVCHTHSTYAVAWAQAKMAIPNFGTTHSDHLVASVPVTEVMTDEAIKNDYELETGYQIVNTLKLNGLTAKDIEMILVACHGPFTWGSNPAKAVYNSVVLEEIAKMAYLTKNLNPSIESIKQQLIDKHYFRKHGKEAYYGQNN